LPSINFGHCIAQYKSERRFSRSTPPLGGAGGILSFVLLAAPPFFE
jgi:hypothetical protein